MRESMYLESKDKLYKDLNEKKAQLKRFEAETEEIRKEYESVMEQKIQKESEVALYQKQIQDLEREQEEIEIRVNAVREGRMRVAGAIERFQTCLLYTSINSSANVLRAALQVVKTAPGTEIVSAFMLMDTQAKDMGENGCFVFADCGLNQNPNPEQLAAIASSSAKTFEQLIGATPRVAMLSHSTCGSAKHDDVTKVVEATNIAKEKYPQYLILSLIHI